MSKKFMIGKEKLPYSQANTIEWDKNGTNKVIISLGVAEQNKELYPCATFNMQTDYANFESIAFAVWSVCESCEIELNFQRSTEAFYLPSDFKLSNLYDEEIKRELASRIQHYMRFLYRAWNMQRLYKKFIISEANKAEVEHFGRQYSEALKRKQLQYVAPMKDADIKKTKNITENHLEKRFVLDGINRGTVFSSIEGAKTEMDVSPYDQLPCGIFYGESENDCHESTRIFNEGAFDLWGIDRTNNEICIFELKREGNYKLGIISELFFYSCVMGDILEIGKGNRKSNYRGFSFLWEEKNNKDLIQAYFLTPDMHSFLKKDNRIAKVIELMNQRLDRKVKYGYLQFDPRNIDKDEIVRRWEKQKESK
ncbi:hypothetical protein [Butyrivibrio sp. NC2007]|uniref:hypothetical protein n=1 Tax=Butyrivibrio sp. NC2007 TaxID=1280683 RepID=UPI0003B6A682|nr:hypothetical protein [Butyrivibrio sp. NC2007]